MSRSIRLDAVLVQAVIAGALSFAHLHDLAEAAGQTGWKAWAYPVSVDLLLVAAWRRMRDQQRAQLPSGGARLWFLVALGASLGANVATAGLLDLDDVPASLRIVVAGWPAVAFFGGTLLAHTPHGQDAPPASASTTPDLDEEPAAPAEIDAPRLDELPAPPITATPVISLPPALVDRVRALAEELRTATGHPADPDTVRARLGLPPSMTPAVAAHLTPTGA
ncbi:DUF2637 domain-containing protein [Streptomyces sp. NPDC004539]|uniref:DUF2637 domain-containing protein n=1 Tax=Streptomyces sp. NPDC004539 TaxID=3154280 RepID=UPI0033B9923B